MNSFEEAKIKQSSFGEVCTGLYNLIFLAENYPHMTDYFEYPYQKKESGMTSYQHRETMAERRNF